ncbi:hypothetical protein CHUV2995_02013 [Corynebacterium diphtheriae subsp. lausannense]|nr:hypothetical protein FRC0043_02615 [Corynebacterium belfantii]SPJ41202.1 hypothetical protein CHUV2995_02013 [Corynebacterium diphtheriae subsp. lausannense]
MAPKQYWNHALKSINDTFEQLPDLHERKSPGQHFPRNLSADSHSNFFNKTHVRQLFRDVNRLRPLVWCICNYRCGPDE